MSRRLLLPLFLLPAAAFACHRRCLACLANSVCAVCDFSLGFVLRNGTCAALDDPLCLLPALEGACLECRPASYLDPFLDRCAPVPLPLRVDNCARFDSRPVCTLCQSGFFLSGVHCLRVATPLSDCLHHASHRACSVCRPGFLLDSSGECRPFASTPNCLRYSLTRCSKCAPGHRLDPLKFFSRLKTVSELFAFLAEQRLSLGGSPISSHDVCVPVDVPECSTFAEDVCTGCNPGFFLTASGSCIRTPFRPISGCLKHSSPAVCLQCRETFFLASPALCLPVSPVPNCLAYDGSANTTQCVLCRDGFFLGTGVCFSRVRSVGIPGCRLPALRADTCGECDLGLSPTTDGLACLPSVPNCQVFSHSDLSTAALRCALCQPDFAPDPRSSSSVCVPGVVAHCRLYGQTSADCAACVNGFYLSNGVCTPQAPLASCAIYDQLRPGFCLQCAPGFLVMRVTQTCLPAPLIPACFVYSSSDPSRCLQCEEGYFLTTDSACSPMPVAQKNCLLLVPSTMFCVRCRDGFMLVAFLGLCAPLPDYLSRHCLQTAPLLPVSDSAFLSPRCLLCANDCISRYGNEDAVCVETAYLTYRRFDTVPNCVRYTSESPFRCCECAPGFVVSSVASATPVCQQGCSPNLVLVLDNLDGFVSACVQMAAPSVFAACKAAIRVRKAPATPDTQYVCIQPDPQRVFPVVTNPSSFASEFVPFPFGACQPRPQRFAHNGYSFLTLPLATAGFASDPLCEVYYHLAMTGAYVCRKCSFGYTVRTNFTGGHSCVPIPANDCDVSATLHGYPSFLEGLLTCHVCFPHDGLPRLPWVHLKWDSVAATITSLFVPPTSQSLSVACQTAPLANSAHFVANCAVYLNLTDSSQAASIFCAACLPSFLPTFSAAPVFRVVSCAPISNCDALHAQKAVNMCQRCVGIASGSASNFALADASMSACTAISVPSCWVARSTSQCLLCLPGFALTSDGTCEEFLIPACGVRASTPNLDAQFSAEFSAPRLYYMSSFFLFVGGCQQCEPGFTRVHLPPSAQWCVPSSFVAANSFAAGSAFVPNCLRYFNTGSSTAFQCQLCRGFFTATSDFRACVAEVANCAFARSDSPLLCAECLSGFVNVGGTCMDSPLPGCLQYLDTSQAALPRCAACSPGFFLTPSASCLPGSIEKCLRYQDFSPLRCLECTAGFVAVSSVDGAFVVCVAADLSGLCATVDSTQLGLAAGTFACTSCTRNRTHVFRVASVSPPSAVCLPFRTVPFCSEYETTAPTLREFAPRCSACESGFFWDSNSNSCRRRLPRDDNCAEFAPAAPTCLRCLPGFHLPPNATLCTTFALAVENCAEMLNESVCRFCDPGHFPERGSCSRTASPPSHCRYLASASHCTVCHEGFYLTETAACAPASIPQCRDYSSASVCSACHPGFGLFRNGTGTTCMSSLLPNCLTSTSVAPFACTLCRPSFYLSEGRECLPVPVPIQDCLEYSGPRTCARCSTDFALQPGGRSCLPLTALEFGLGCIALESLYSPVCSLCLPGFNLTAQKACQALDQTFGGCLWSFSVPGRPCDACASGFQSTPSGTCIKVAPDASLFEGVLAREASEASLGGSVVVVALAWVSFLALAAFSPK